MSFGLAGVLPLLLALSGSAGPFQNTPQQPRTIELDAATLAARTEAARSLIPLLEDVRQKASSRYEVDKGSPPDSPFAGRPTTLFSIAIGRKNEPVSPQVLKAMDRLIEWEPGNRTAAEETVLFDAWFSELSKRASAIATSRGLVTCDTACVVATLTELDDKWGSTAQQRPAARDRMLLETFTVAVKKTK
jgi:hypothetical protein